MNKNKVAKIILYSLLAALGGLVVALYIFQKDLVMEWYGIIVDVLNRPLPIVGVTTLAVLIFVWRLVISTNYGKKKLAFYDQKLKEIEQAKKELEEEKEKAINELKEENNTLRTQFANACALSTNKKIKDYGKELENYGKETTDIETKDE